MTGFSEPDYNLAMLPASAPPQLEERGFLILPALIPPAQVARLNERVEELFALEGDSAGSEFKTEPGAHRIANVVDKGQVFEEAIDHPAVLAAIVKPFSWIPPLLESVQH